MAANHSYLGVLWFIEPFVCFIILFSISCPLEPSSTLWTCLHLQKTCATWERVCPSCSSTPLSSQHRSQQLEGGVLRLVFLGHQVPPKAEFLQVHTTPSTSVLHKDPECVISSLADGSGATVHFQSSWTQNEGVVLTLATSKARHRDCRGLPSLDHTRCLSSRSARPLVLWTPLLLWAGPTLAWYATVSVVHCEPSPHYAVHEY